MTFKYFWKNCSDSVSEKVRAASTSALSKNRKAAISSPPGEREFVEIVVVPGQEALLRDVWLDAHLIALTLDVHLHTVQQVFDGGCGFPGPKRHHGLLVRLQAVDGAVVETPVLLRPQHTDHDGGVPAGGGLGPGDTDQHLGGKAEVTFGARQQPNMLDDREHLNERRASSMEQLVSLELFTGT